MLGFENGTISPIQIFVVGNEILDAWFHVEFFQHVFSDKVGEIAHCFERDRLMEELQSLFRRQAEVAPESCAVLGEAVEEFDPFVSEISTKLGEFGAEV